MGAREPCFLDTNIWLYAFEAESAPEKTEIAQRVIREHRQIFVSSQVLNEICVNLLRKFNATERDIRALIDSFYARYDVIPLDRTSLLSASELRSAYALSYWDSLIVASALSTGVATLFSEDMQNGLSIDGRLTTLAHFDP